ncbi:MAG: hypothetical protein MI725_01340 [Pirellulales bacterium]|nr:hypothetical protein [Pirellulales bacterium]
MNSETFQGLLRRQPFQPLEVRMSNGGVHQIRHPEMALLLRSNIILGSPESDKFEFLSMLHVVDVKAIPVGSGGTNGESPTE